MAALGTIGADLGALTESRQGARIAALMTRSLAVPLALLVLLACFLSALTSPVQSATLIGLGNAMDDLGRVPQRRKCSAAANRASMIPSDAAHSALRRTAHRAVADLWPHGPASLNGCPCWQPGPHRSSRRLLVVMLRSAILSMVLISSATGWPTGSALASAHGCCCSPARR